MEDILRNDNLQPTTFLEHFRQKHISRSTIVNNQTNVIVANKAMAALTPIPKTNQNYEAIIYNNKNNITQNDDNQKNLNINPPSPPPLRRLRSRCIVNTSNDVNHVNNSQQQHHSESVDLHIINNSETPIKNEPNDKSDDDDKNSIQTETSPITSGSKRSLPHKKRITKKMKNLNKQQQQQLKDDTNTTIITTISIKNTDNSHTNNKNNNSNINIKDLLQFKCQLCGLLSETQLDFFAHLKSHYEPTIKEENPLEGCDEVIVKNETQQHQTPQQPVIIFNEKINTNKLENINSEEPINNNKTTMKRQYNTKNKRKKNLINNNLKKNNKRNNKNNTNTDLLNMPIVTQITTREAILSLNEEKNIVDNLHARIILPTMTSITSPTKIDSMLEEFSEPEDMLEGIRNVVENVQDAIDDTTQLDQFLINKIDDKKSDPNDENIDAAQSKTMTNHLNIKKKLHATDDFLLKLTNKYKIRDYEYEVNADNQDGVINRIVNNDEDNVDDDLNSNDMTNKNIGNMNESSDGIMATSEDDKMDTKEGSKTERKTSTSTSTSITQAKNYKKKRQRCGICGKSFNSKNASQYHELSHTGERPHQCDVCGKRFYSTSALKVHMRVHTGIRPYPCEKCDKSFRQWGDLKYHMTSLHSTEKNHQCEFCGKDFSRRYSLVVHRRIHTGERNYICEYCNKTFRACSYLQNHRRIHTGEKPHECNVCGKKFRVRSDMKRHINTHTRNANNKLAATNQNTRNKITNLELKKEDDCSSNNSITNKSLIYSDKEIDIYRKKQQQPHTEIIDDKNNIINDYFKREIDLVAATASQSLLLSQQQQQPVITATTSETKNLINIKLIKKENDLIQPHQVVIIHDNVHANIQSPPSTNTVNNESIFIFPVINC